MKKYVTPEILTCILNSEDVLTTSAPTLAEETDTSELYGQLKRIARLRG